MIKELLISIFFIFHNNIIMKIGIVIGINTDAISEERYPQWLEDIDDKLFNKSKEKWNDTYGLASDAGIAHYVQKYSKIKV